MRIIASWSSSCRCVTTGRRPISSGIRPNCIRSWGSTRPRNSSRSTRAVAYSSSRAKPSMFLPTRRSTIFSRPWKAPPQTNRMLRVLTSRYFCCGMLASALGRHVGHGALEDLQQGLLHALARDVAGDRGVAALAPDLVDLVDVDDALLGGRDVVVGGLQQAHQDVLHVLAHVAGLGQGRGVGDGEGHVQEAGQGLGQQRLAGAGVAQQQDVALVDLDAVAGLLLVDALVVVVDRDGEADLGLFLADHVLVEVLADLPGLGEAAAAPAPSRPAARPRGCRCRA